MSLVTLDINEVADVIDEAITRHVLVSHNNNKANTLVNDILSFRTDLQKLSERVEEGRNKTQEYLLQKIGEIRASFEVLVKDEVDKIPVPRDGEPGRDGISIDIDEVKAYILEEVSKIPIPRDGENGKDVDIDTVLSFVKQELDRIPLPTNGKDGIDGISGVDGKDGSSVSLEDVKSYIEEISRQVVSTIPLPKDGVGLAGAMIDRTGNLFVTCTNGNTIPLGMVVGVDGKDGKDGIPGKDGIDGVAGKDGTNGTNGENGRDGEHGLDGKDGVDGTSITIDDIKPIVEQLFSTIPIPKDGKDGDIGPSGIDGINGKDGRDGVDGKDGSLGASGIDGKDGVNGIDGKDGISGLDGKDGQNGKDGIDGKDGRDGIDGVNGKDAIIDNARLEVMINTFVKSYVDKKSIETLPTLEEIPDDVAEKVAKAISIVAESPIVVTHQQQQQQPIVVNVTQPAPITPPPTSNAKRIVTSRDSDGNIIADVISIDKTFTVRRNKDGTIIGSENE